MTIGVAEFIGIAFLCNVLGREGVQCNVVYLGGKSGAEVGIVNRKVVRRARAGQTFPLVRSTWGTSQGEDKLGARDKILNTKVARRACAGHAPGKHSPMVSFGTRYH